MIGVSIRELSALKILEPIIEQFIKLQVPYNIYYYDVKRGAKEYNRASPANINASNSRILKYSQKHDRFKSNKHLYDLLKNDRIKKFVGIEIALCHPDHDWGPIKTYSLLYLTDSMWNSSSRNYTQIHKTYFTSKHIMSSALSFSGAKFDKNKHKYLGSPLFDQLAGISGGPHALVLLPNIRAEHVQDAFGNAHMFIDLIKQIASKRSLIFKTRKKQWMPKQIQQYAHKIVFDGTNMYPNSLTKTLSTCDTVIMFNSSGIYECVAAGKMIYNIPLPNKCWRWDPAKMKQYFSYSENSLYNWCGVVKTITQTSVTKENFCNQYDIHEASKWIDKFIGNLDYAGTQRIADSIINE